MNTRILARRAFFCCLAILVESITQVRPVSIEDTTGYIFGPYDFSAGDHAIGRIGFKNGFSIPAGGRVIFDTDGVSFGCLNLNNSGSMELYSDFKLGTTAAFSRSGFIKGNGQSLILTSSLRLSSLQRLKFIGDTIIDGQGNTMILDNGAQLWVDSGVTLTLKNLVLRSGYNNATFPALNLNSATSKLALDNAVLCLANHMSFTSGKLYLHNDVSITGSSTFSYRSPSTSYITPGSTLYVDPGTIFAYVPGSGSSSKDLFQMVDGTSRFYLNGCTLKTTSTGMRLMRGQVLFENRVVVDTALDTPNALTFGDGSSTANNVNVRVLSGSRVEINGMIVDNTV